MSTNQPQNNEEFGNFRSSSKELRPSQSIKTIPNSIANLQAVQYNRFRKR